ncbi:MAG: hypothetical protein KGI46_10020 [Alphaproteobacteria bacterium]|nr:hypothetical protein [Alphaproteobacteria bacterium]
MAAKKVEGHITHRLPDDQRVLAAVGEIALRHGQLDNQLRMLVKDLTDVTKEEALDATAREGSRELRDRINKLAKRRLGEGAPLVRLQALLARAARATAKRNELLHGVWGMDLDRDVLMIRDESHAFKRAPSAPQLERLSETITDVLADMVQARVNGGFLNDALQKTSKGA